MTGGGVLRVACRVAGVLLLVACFSFRADFTEDDVETRDEWSVGVWFSPWLVGSEVVRREKSELGTTEDRKSSVRVTALNWSWVALAAGAWLLLSGRRRAPATTPSAPTPA